MARGDPGSRGRRRAPAGGRACRRARGSPRAPIRASLPRGSPRPAQGKARGDGAGEDSSRRPAATGVVPGRFRGPRRTPVPPGRGTSARSTAPTGRAALSEQGVERADAVFPGPQGENRPLARRVRHVDVVGHHRPVPVRGLDARPLPQADPERFGRTVGTPGPSAHPPRRHAWTVGTPGLSAHPDRGLRARPRPPRAGRAPASAHRLVASRPARPVGLPAGGPHGGGPHRREEYDLTPDDALARLRAHAFGHDRALLRAARDVIDDQCRPGPW